ncbi:MAG TPA: hypothetical protein VED01_23535 [Burkholderiales bacterium]|nr:hypothetical protein [Burkholderiales bacterium]
MNGVVVEAVLVRIVAATRMSRCIVVAVTASLGLSGCTSGMGAAVVSLRQLVASQNSADSEALDPNFAYLRVTNGRHTGLLWRGSMEPSADGPIEVYYSSTGEVLRLQRGRVVGALGVPTEWRQVWVKAPAWRDIARSGGTAYVRVRDVMPGYRSGVKDELSARVVPAPSKSAMRVLEPSTLTWFEETIRTSSGIKSGRERLPPARYAVRLGDADETVVYGEQCLAPDFCFTWQRWSATIQQNALAATAGAP